MTSRTVSFPSVRNGITTTATIERTTYTLTVHIDGQPVVSMFRGRDYTCLVDNEHKLADAFRTLCEVAE